MKFIDSPVFMKLRSIVLVALNVVPFGKMLRYHIGWFIQNRRNYGNLKFQGSRSQDMITYLYFKKKSEGFYIDIGANNGISLSNTYVFEKLGWDGICVEPQYDVFQELKRTRKCYMYNVAVDANSGEADFFQDDVDLGSKLMTSNVNIAREKRRGTIIKVKTLTFDKIMENHPDVKYIDFMSIDTEGAELRILESIDFKKYKFGLITVEDNEKHGVLENFMKTKGYKKFMEAVENAGGGGYPVCS
ncbi:hypothetical protein AGMMS50212_03080 [Spirochaetia bacterium]|nr:hypothetical protein AGMMS50212_03080 [Spirochaetia bacterium]